MANDNIKIFNEVRRVNGVFGSYTVTDYNTVFAVDLGLDGISKLMFNIARVPDDVKSLLEGNDTITTYAVAGNVSKLGNYALATFQSLTSVFLFGDTEKELNELSFEGLDSLANIYVKTDLYDNYVAHNPSESRFTKIVTDYGWNVPYIETEPLTTELMNNLVGMMSTGQKASVEKVTFPINYDRDDVIAIAWNYNWSVFPILDNTEIYYGDEKIDFSTLNVEGSGTLTNEIVDNAIASVLSARINGITKLVIADTFTQESVIQILKLNITTWNSMLVNLNGNVYFGEQELFLLCSATIIGLGNEDPSTVTFNVGTNFPTTFETVSDNYGNYFKRFPTMYRKINSVVEGQITSFTISPIKFSDDFKPYSVYVKPNGEIMNEVLIGIYNITSSSIANSVTTGYAPQTIGNARTNAVALGNGYQLFDWQFRQLIVDVSLMVKKIVLFYDNKLLGMSNWNGNTGQDGMAGIDGKLFVCYDPTKYVDNPTENSDGYYELSYLMGGYGRIKTLGYDTNHPFAIFPQKNGANPNTYYGQEMNIVTTGSKLAIITIGNSNAGIWRYTVDGSFSSNTQCRLCYRPIDE